MKPIKNLEPCAFWMLRIGVLLWLISQYKYVFQTFQYEKLSYIMDATTLLLGILLFIGGFTRTSTLSIISGIGLCAITLYQMYPLCISSQGITLLFNATLYAHFVVASIGLLFAAHGNK